MPNAGDKLLLRLMRALVYGKRATVYLWQRFLWLAGVLGVGYRRTIGLSVYRIKLAVKRAVGNFYQADNRQFLDWVSRRGVTQLILLGFSLFLIYPFSKLAEKTNQDTVGHGTLLYQLAGPSEEIDVEQAEATPAAAANPAVRSWREGALSPSVVVKAPGGEVSTPTVLGGITMGGLAITKPTIISTPLVLTPTSAASPKQTVVIYTVEAGDTLSAIAKKFQLQVTTILWANKLSLRSKIHSGEKLKILPIDGIVYQVKRGDTIAKIAKKFKVAGADIITLNQLAKDGTVTRGQELLIPHGVPLVEPARTLAPTPEPAIVSGPVPSESYLPFIQEPTPPRSSETASGGQYIWPTAIHRITQYFGLRHTGLDIGGKLGLPLYASRSGTVVRSQCGWNGGYGCYVIIDHGNGIQTLYGHAAELLVGAGEDVSQGQAIALMGATGRSTGPHIHFEVRIKGRRVNPLRYIR